MGRTEIFLLLQCNFNVISLSSQSKKLEVIGGIVTGHEEISFNTCLIQFPALLQSRFPREHTNHYHLNPLLPSLLYLLCALHEEKSLGEVFCRDTMTVCLGLCFVPWLTCVTCTLVSFHCFIFSEWSQKFPTHCWLAWGKSSPQSVKKWRYIFWTQERRVYMMSNNV